MSEAVLAQLDPDTWQSLRGSKTEWSHAAVIDCASKMLEALPSAVKDKIIAGEYKGSDLLRISSGRPKQNDVRTNALWLRPIITHFPSKTSSVYPAAFGKSRHRAWTGEQYPGPEKNKDHK